MKSHQKKQLQKSSGIYRTVGLVLILGSLAYSLLISLALDNGNFVVFSGLLVVGVGCLIKGFIDNNA